MLNLDVKRNFKGGWESVDWILSKSGNFLAAVFYYFCDEPPCSKFELNKSKWNE